jgi:hypothetical protein
MFNNKTKLNQDIFKYNEYEPQRIRKKSKKDIQKKIIIYKIVAKTELKKCFFVHFY